MAIVGKMNRAVDVDLGSTEAELSGVERVHRRELVNGFMRGDYVQALLLAEGECVVKRISRDSVRKAMIYGQAVNERKPCG
jgi:hypothetical protein